MQTELTMLSAIPTRSLSSIGNFLIYPVGFEDRKFIGTLTKAVLISTPFRQFAIYKVYDKVS